MGYNPTKAAGNIYCQCRKKAAKYNDKLNSREGAAEALGISSSQLADYELDVTKFIPVDRVVKMADLYNAPELRNHYCTNECPIGIGRVQELEDDELDRIAIKLLSSLRRNDCVKDMLLDITADGKITPDEETNLNQIISYFDKLAQFGQELKVWAERNKIE